MSKYFLRPDNTGDKFAFIFGWAILMLVFLGVGWGGGFSHATGMIILVLIIGVFSFIFFALYRGFTRILLIDDVKIIIPVMGKHKLYVSNTYSVWQHYTSKWLMNIEIQNIKDIYKVESPEELAHLRFNRDELSELVNKQNIETYFARQYPKKAVCIVFQKPIEYRNREAGKVLFLGTDFPKLEKIYVAIEKRDELIETIKSRTLKL